MYLHEHNYIYLKFEGYGGSRCETVHNLCANDPCRHNSTCQVLVYHVLLKVPSSEIQQLWVSVGFRWCLSIYIHVHVYYNLLNQSKCLWFCKGASFFFGNSHLKVISMCICGEKNNHIILIIGIFGIWNSWCVKNIFKVANVCQYDWYNYKLSN